VDEITVFADVSCPFAYVGFTRILAYRDRIGPDAAPLRARAWPLAVVNGDPMTGPALVPKIEALRRDVAPDLFGGFAPDRFPSTSLPALAAEQAAYRAGLDRGMAFSLAVRRLLFEDGEDIGDPDVVGALLGQLDLPQPTADDRAAVERDHEAGVAMGVQGSPHFFTRDGSFFCPTLDIQHHEGGYDIEFDQAGFERFISSAFG
jgi:2-hydroxychromene-2-carboxylate isomerase